MNPKTIVFKDLKVKNIKKDLFLEDIDISLFENIAKDRRVIPDPIDDRKFQE